VVCLVWATASSVAWGQLPDGLGKDLTVQVCGKEAEAIAKYRKENGAFKIVDDLKKVPGLDFKKIEAKKDRLAL
jgi:competence ComEA-like helix-hairpin-helix protein